MALVVMKFGGKLLESPARIGRAAGYIVSAYRSGDRPVVVVSAPGRTTDYFMRLARRVAAHPDERELDMLLSTGERLAMALLAMAINATGEAFAVSFTGSQVGIITDTRHTDATIIDVKGDRVRDALEQGRIPIVAGFQGVSTEREITTLGRGGSDATAVALAAALKADRCELIKEAGGLFTADPMIVGSARPIREIDYEGLERMASTGARVVQTRAAAIARQWQVPLAIKGLESQGTRVVAHPSLEGPATAITLARSLHWSRGSSAKVPGSGEYLLHFTHGSEVWSLIRAAGAGDVDLVTLIGWSGGVPGNIPGELIALLDGNGLTRLALVAQPGIVSVVVKSPQGEAAARLLHDLADRFGWLGRDVKPLPAVAGGL
ncbi:MAG: hypothetical protein FJY67_02515 [Calditrichaeota bacterium]|nr:hypothetical protein [Calditrichota bacterium]